MVQSAIAIPIKDDGDDDDDVGDDCNYETFASKCIGAIAGKYQLWMGTAAR